MRKDSVDFHREHEFIDLSVIVLSAPLFDIFASAAVKTDDSCF